MNAQDPQELSPGSLGAPHWQRFAQALGPAGGAEAPARAARVRQRVEEDGATYNIAGHPRPHPWPLELLPCILPPEEWQAIEAGVHQRARLLEAAMVDLYGPQHLLRDALLPASLVYAHPQFVREVHGLKPAGGLWLRLLAFDLKRGPDGRWRLLAQRLQAPSGIGYLLQNRLIVAPQFPEAFAQLGVQPLAASFAQLKAGLLFGCPAGAQGRLVLLTPGPWSETYFEQNFLARHLGVPLVEGSDLTVRGQRLYLKTLGGLEPVHAVLRRVDDEFLDPLELQPDSALGVPGLLQAVRAGQVVLANLPGVGVLESPGLTAFWPGACEALLGEPLGLHGATTWWCGEAAVWRRLRPDLADFVVVPTFPSVHRHEAAGAAPRRASEGQAASAAARGVAEGVATGFAASDAGWSPPREATAGPVVMADLTPQAQAAWASRIDADPAAYTLQARFTLSDTPVWTDAGLDHRAAVVRVFALRDGQGGWRVLPGGLTRVEAALPPERAGAAATFLPPAATAAGDAAGMGPAGHGEHVEHGDPAGGPAPGRTPRDPWLSMQHGSTSADTWVLGNAELAAQPLAPPPLQAGDLQAQGRRVTSRAAESLFWLGRCTERAETALHFVQQTAPVLAAGGWTPLPGAAAQGLGPSDPQAVSRWLAGLAHWQGLAPSPQLRGLELAAAMAASAAPHFAHQLGLMRDGAQVVRDRLTPEHWGWIQSGSDTPEAVPPAQLLAAITGAQTDRMARDDGWRLLMVGRHLERLDWLARLLAQALQQGAAASEEGFGLLLALTHSLVAYRARFQARREALPLVQMLVLDEDQPRSLAWVIERLRRNLQLLAAHDPAWADSVLARLPEAGAWRLQVLAETDGRGRLGKLLGVLDQCQQAAFELARQIDRRLFTHVAPSAWRVWQ